jgi:hypothetical protein
LKGDQADETSLHADTYGLQLSGQKAGKEEHPMVVLVENEVDCENQGEDKEDYAVSKVDGQEPNPAMGHSVESESHEEQIDNAEKKPTGEEGHEGDTSL